MIGLIVATHSTLCQGLKESGAFVSGPHENAFFIQLDSDGVEAFRGKLAALIREVHKTHDGVLFLTDLKNATPYNEISRHIFSGANPGDRLLSGVNLAMYIEAAVASKHTADIDELAELALFAGRASIARLETFDVEEQEDDL